MECVINSLRIPSLKKQIEASRLYSEALTRQFEQAQADWEKTKVTSLHDEALKQLQTLHWLLELLERQEREQSKTQGC